MDRQRWMVICGVAAIILYTLSWFMEWIEIPGKGWMRLSAILPFVIGGSILLYDRYKKSQAQGRQPKSKSGWEDILGDDEESKE